MARIGYSPTLPTNGANLESMHATPLQRSDARLRAGRRARRGLLLLCLSRAAARPWQLARCRGPKQVKYSAAWLAARDLLHSLPESYLNTSRLTKPGTMMEAASFLLLERAPRTTKTRDLLDFYVEHLSWYERRLLVATKGDRKPLAYARRVLRETLSAIPHRNQRHLDAVAIMPYYAAGRGQGPSSIDMRGVYLNATISSIRSALTTNIVVAVENARDLAFVETCCGALGDVLYLPNIKPNKLGAATVIAAHRLVTGKKLQHALLYSRDGARAKRWDANAELGYVGSRRAHSHGTPPAFWTEAKYVYYTESDQLLRVRASKALATMALGADPTKALLLPHRVVPLPTPQDFPAAPPELLATDELRFNGAWSAAPLNAARDACCFPSDSHACEHAHVQPLDALRASTRLLRADGFSLVPGEGNFLRMEFRACAHESGGGGRACA